MLQIKVISSFTDVVHSPERLQTRIERFSYKLVITVSIALILLGRIVHTRVNWVLGRVLLLARLEKLF